MAKQRGAFVGVTCPGRRVQLTDVGSVCDGWTVGGTLVLPGYHAERKVCLRRGGLCSVALRVGLQDGRHEKPVFSCECTCQGTSHCGVECGDSAAVVCNSFLVSCGAKPAGGGGKRWAGPSFFGFDRADVRSATNEAALLPRVKPEDLDVYLDATTSTSRNDKHVFVHWVGVVKFGKVVESPHWVLDHGDTFVYLRDGYTSMRQVTTRDGTAMDIDCCVMMGDEGKPLFKCLWCVADVRHEASGPSANEAVRELFSHITCPTTKMVIRWNSVLWSSPAREFFLIFGCCANL